MVDVDKNGLISKPVDGGGDIAPEVEWYVPSSGRFKGQLRSRVRWNRGGWTRQQKRCFNRLTSWCFEAKSRDCLLNRVDLTTAPGGNADLLRRHLQELRRRVERELGFNGVEMFVVEPTEGNGVLHMVWAWSGGRDFIIDQRWLSKQWRRIHGAPIVFIRRMRLSKEDIRRVGRYFALQYLSDQRGALKRISWSWRRSRFAIGKAWAFMVKAYRSRSKFSTWCGVSSDLVDVSFSDLLVAWEELLEHESCMLGSTLFGIKDREVKELF